MSGRRNSISKCSNTGERAERARGGSSAPSNERVGRKDKSREPAHAGLLNQPVTLSLDAGKVARPKGFQSRRDMTTRVSSG